MIIIKSLTGKNMKINNIDAENIHKSYDYLPDSPILYSQHLMDKMQQGYPVTVQVTQNVPTTILRNTKMFSQIGVFFFLYFVIKKI